LCVRRGGRREDEPADDEDDRRQAERDSGRQPERVVDRRADVAVGRREERGRAENTFEALALTPAPGHRRTLFLRGDAAHEGRSGAPAPARPDASFTKSREFRSRLVRAAAPAWGVAREGHVRDQTPGSALRMKDASGWGYAGSDSGAGASDSCPRVGTLLRTTCGSKRRHRLIEIARGPRRRRKRVSIRSGRTTFTAVRG